MDDELMQTLLELLAHCQAAIFHIAAIEAEEDPEIITIHIEALEQLDKKHPSDYPIREAIKIGQGDFHKIQDKCVRLGLV